MLMNIQIHIQIAIILDIPVDIQLDIRLSKPINSTVQIPTRTFKPNEYKVNGQD